MRREEEFASPYCLELRMSHYRIFKNIKAIDRAAIRLVFLSDALLCSKDY